MSESAPMSIEPDATNASQPGFLGALRGIWLMTWRSQLTLRKLPAQLGLLLVLPVPGLHHDGSPETGRGGTSLWAILPGVERFSRRLERERFRFRPKTSEASTASYPRKQRRNIWNEQSPARAPRRAKSG
jgi:hypothetical protein